MSIVTTESVVSVSDWIKGIGLSVVASVIGGASKLAIRKSWLLEQRVHHVHAEGDNEEDDVPLENQQHHDTTTDTPGTVGPIIGDTGSSIRSLGVSDSEVAVTHRYSHSTSEYAPDHSSTNSTRYLPHDRLRHTPSLQSSMYGRSWPLMLRLSGMFGMTVLNPLCCVLAMNYASPSILAPFSGLTLVWIVLFSHPLIGELPTMPQIMAAALIVLGNVVVAAFGDHTNDENVTVSDVRLSYKNGPFLLYIALATVWFLVLTLTILYARSDVVRRIAWGASGGSLTGFQNFLKDTLTIIKATSDTPHQRPWALLAFLICMAILTAFGGLLLLTACMKRYDATYSAAMFVGSFVIAASIMSAIHYDTVGHLDGVINLILYPVGLLILMSGVCMLAGSSPALSTDFHNTVVHEGQNATSQPHATQALLVLVGYVVMLAKIETLFRA